MVDTQTLQGSKALKVWRQSADVVDLELEMDDVSIDGHGGGSNSWQLEVDVQILELVCGGEDGREGIGMVVWIRHSLAGIVITELDVCRSQARESPRHHSLLHHAAQNVRRHLKSTDPGGMHAEHAETVMVQDLLR